jgi:hypothetical protein
MVGKEVAMSLGLEIRRAELLPATSLGRWAVALGAAFFPLVFAAPLVPGAAALGLACGLASGVAAVTAIVRRRERAPIVFAALLPTVIALGFGVAEVIFVGP